MNIVDKIKLKTEQIYTKTDQFLRNHGAVMGMGVAVASVTLGITGIALAATAATAPLSAPLALAASAASATGSTWLGIPVTAAGSLMLNGGYLGLAFAGLSKLYRQFRGGKIEDFVWGPQQLSCIDKEGNTVKRDALTVYKEIELGTFKDKYTHMGTENYKTKSINYNESKDLTLESAMYKILGPDLYKDDPYSSSIVDNVETVRRVLFKESNNYAKMADLSDKIKRFREEVKTDSSHKFAI